MNAVNQPLLTLEDVHVRFAVGTDWRGRPKAQVHALNGIDLTVERGEILGVVGESGCGKSTLANVLTRLVEPSSGRLAWAADGRGERSASADDPASRLQIVFQDPQSSLDPRLPVWRVISEPVFVRQRRSVAELRRLAGDLAEQVGLRREQLDRYPHEFSGGQRQRIAIARALASDPDVIVLDEPTSALDISVQAQILNLLADLRRQRGLTYILISHNLSVIRHLCDRVAVMYLGQIVELGATAEVLARPAHPYTRLLLDALPAIGKPLEAGLSLADCELPSKLALPPGCYFHDRCAYAAAGCQRPQALHAPAGTAHHVRCQRAAEIAAPE